MNGILVLRRFEEIDLNDEFFDSLKSDYVEFGEWFLKKKDKEAFVQYDSNGNLQGFLYIKTEDGPVDDVSPKLEFNQVLKIGTFKINPHGTRLGERFIKKALDHAMHENVDACYVTIFEKHSALVALFEKYGFIKMSSKKTSNGEELVLVKDFSIISGDVLKDYPLIDMNNGDAYLLAIDPQYHSKMFPDSILNTENVDMLEDITYTNSIHKNYVTKMKGIENLKQGDKIVIYRKAEVAGTAEYKSVVTSICQVRNLTHTRQYDDFNHFYKHANAYSIFTEKQLLPWYTKGSYLIKMTYNAAFQKRLTRHKLIEEIGLNRKDYFGFLKITQEQFEKICEEGEVCEGIIVD